MTVGRGSLAVKRRIASLQSSCEKRKAPVGGTTEALSVKTNQPKKGINMSDSKAVILSSPLVFNFGEHTVRVMVCDGDPWFVASDVAKALEFQDAAKAARMLPEKHKRALKGMHQATLISEGGLYRMVLRSRKPSAIAFSDWVMDEVLPSMRKIVTDKHSTRPDSPALTYQRISPAQAQDLKEIVDAIASAGSQKHGEIWAHFQKKFKVNSYLQLPAAQHLDARQYLLAKLPSGYAHKTEDVALKPAIASERSHDVRIKGAFDVAARAGAHVQRTVFKAIMNGDSNWKHQRLLLAFVNNGNTVGPAYVECIESGSLVTTWSRLTESIRHDECPYSAAQLLEMATACMQRLNVISDLKLNH